jgi:hypothetical protein
MINLLKFFQTKKKTNHRKLKIGDRIELSGGYDYEIKYLENPPARERVGTVINFMRNSRKFEDYSAIVKLDGLITANSVISDIIILSTRYENQEWGYTGIVHIVLCLEIPKNIENEKFGERIEAAASYIIIN